MRVNKGQIITDIITYSDGDAISAPNSVSTLIMLILLECQGQWGKPAPDRPE